MKNIFKQLFSFHKSEAMKEAERVLDNLKNKLEDLKETRNKVLNQLQQMEENLSQKTYSEDEVKNIINETVNKTCLNLNEFLRLKLVDTIFEQLRKKDEKVFYRVCHEETLRGLWYDYKGNFTGLIHNEFNFCKHKDLQMDYDPELVGWLSATDTLDKLFEWFPPSDILKLQQEGWYLHKFVATDVKFYDRFQHLVINQETSKPIEKLVLVEVSKVPQIVRDEVKTIKDGDIEVIIM